MFHYRVGDVQPSARAHASVSPVHELLPSPSTAGHSAPCCLSHCAACTCLCAPVICSIRVSCAADDTTPCCCRHCITAILPPCAALLRMLAASQGQPCSNSHFSVAKCPLYAADPHAVVDHGHCCECRYAHNRYMAATSSTAHCFLTDFDTWLLL
jgi:hypothetical protein